MKQTATKTRVWDLPTRLFHWALVVCVVGALVTVKLGGNWMQWHLNFGITTLALLVFRVIWGLVGPRYARFSSFLPSVRATWDHVCSASTSTQRHAGHNPLGAWSVYALLGMLLLQASTGLFATDDIMYQGPLSVLVSNDLVAQLTSVHKLGELVIFALLALHLIAIALYTIKGHGLVGPMIHGDANQHNLTAGTLPAQDDWRVRLGGLVLAVILACIAWWLATAQFGPNLS
jgi:cytochrome b